jgi:type II secretory pathway component GspD/PulD (secretin)
VLRICSIHCVALGLLSLASGVVAFGQELAPTGAPTEPAAKAPVAAATQETEKTAEPKAKSEGKADTQTTSTDAKTGEKKRKLTFVYTPWKDVIEDLAEWADLDIIADKYPPGTCFHKVQDREYTAQEAIDALNGQLLVKGYTLIVYQRMLIVRDLADVIPDDVVPFFMPDELDSIGRFRVAKCLFSFTRFTPAEVEIELRAVVSNWARLQVLPKLRQVVVTDTGEKLRKIRDMLADDVNLSNFKAIQLRAISPDEALSIIRVLLRFPVGQDSAADGSISVAVDTGGNRLLVTGTPDKLKQLEDILKVLDPTTEGPGKEAEKFDIVVYPITSADPASCMKVLESLLVGNPGVRIGLDPMSNMITVWAPKSVQDIAKATLDKLQGLTLDFEVIGLKKMGVEEAKTLLDGYFGGGESGTNKKAPSIVANLGTQQLYVRGTSLQIQEIKTMLSKLDVMTDDKDATVGSTVRTIPIYGRAAARAVDQINMQWGLMKKNRIKVVYPEGMKAPEGIRSTTPAEGGKSERPTEDPENRATGFEKVLAPATRGKVTATRKSMTRLVSWQEPTQDPGAPVQGQDEPPPVTMTITPGGIIITSDDTKALDELEAMILAFQNQQRSAVDDFTVIYLKHAKAEVASELLREIIGGVDAVSGGGGGLLGGMANAALGQNMGGMMNQLMGGGGGGSPSESNGVVTAGPVTIVPDTRLNALFVQAAPVDLDLVEQLVSVMDQQDGPQDPLSAGSTNVIPLVNAKAAEVAESIKASLPSEYFASANQQNRQPNPQEMLALLTGGRGGGRNSSQRRQQEGPKITLGTHEKNNWLIVTAPENLFKQVQGLAIELDAGAEGATQQTVAIVRPKRANGSTLKSSVATILNLKTSSGTTASSPTSTTAQNDASRRAGQQPFQPGGGFQPGGFQFPAGGFGNPGGGGQFRVGPGGGIFGGGNFGGGQGGGGRQGGGGGGQGGGGQGRQGGQGGGGGRGGGGFGGGT